MTWWRKFKLYHVSEYEINGKTKGIIVCKKSGSQISTEVCLKSALRFDKSNDCRKCIGLKPGEHFPNEFLVEKVIHFPETKTILSGRQKKMVVGKSTNRTKLIRRIRKKE